VSGRALFFVLFVTFVVTTLLKPSFVSHDKAAAMPGASRPTAHRADDRAHEVDAYNEAFENVTVRER